MKLTLTVFTFLLFAFQSFAQQEISIFKQGVQGCYSDYYIEFHNRGASAPTDGEYEVVISVIYNNQSECYTGKATIQGGKLVRPVYVKKNDGTFSTLTRMFRDFDQTWLAQQDPQTLNEVSDGMSSLFVTQEQYRVRLFFPSLLATNSVVNQKAPPVGELTKKGN
jgi:hypothetical protein